MNIRPLATEYAPFYGTYVSLVPETDIVGTLASQLEEVSLVARAVPSGKEVFRYAEGKWSLRQVFGHMVDAERVFGYRVFCIARGERAHLPSFDENEYVARADFENVLLSDLAAEFHAARQSHLLFLKRFSNETMNASGTASGKPVTVRALMYIMAGHIRHHIGIIHDRYGIPAGR